MKNVRRDLRQILDYHDYDAIIYTKYKISDLDYILDVVGFDHISIMISSIRDEICEE